MKIAFDTSQTGTKKAGCGYYAHALANILPEHAPGNEYFFLQSFGDFFFDAELSRKLPGKKKNIQTGPFLFDYESAKSYWQSPNLEEALGNPDIIHSNNYWCPTQLKTSKLIYTLYDLSFMEQPDWTTEANRIGCFEGVFRSAVSADWIVAISESSRKHFCKYFPHFPEGRVKVIYPASRFMKLNKVGTMPKVLRNYQPGKFWLSVGTIEPRKNQKLLAQAYARYLALGGTPMPMVFAGGAGWKMDDFEDYIGALGISEHVILTGYISDEELVWLYRNCYANLYPSLFEGFGLPVLEGMQFGAPTIASNRTSIPEIAADSAITLDPDNVEVWAQTLFHLSNDEPCRDNLVEKSVKQASNFNWQSSAKMLLDLYDEASKSSKQDEKQT